MLVSWRRKWKSIATSLLGVLAVGLVTCPTAAYADVINFGSLSQAGSFLATEGGSYTQQGFTFTSDTLAVWEASSGNLPDLDTADTSLFEYYAYGTTSLTAAGDAAFTLNSIDLAPLLAGATGAFNVTFVGTFADASTISQTFTVSDSTPTALQTFDFSGFTNVVSVSFEQGTNGGFFTGQDDAYQFDNVVVNSSAAVPEPGSLLLLATCVAGLMGLSLQRAAATRSKTSLGRPPVLDDVID
jgi:hypothetical protein